MKPINAVITMWVVHIGAVAALTASFAVFSADVPELPCNSLRVHVDRMQSLQTRAYEKADEFEERGSFEAAETSRNVAESLEGDIERYTYELEMKCDTESN